MERQKSETTVRRFDNLTYGEMEHFSGGFDVTLPLRYSRNNVFKTQWPPPFTCDLRTTRWSECEREGAEYAVVLCQRTHRRPVTVFRHTAYTVSRLLTFPESARRRAPPCLRAAARDPATACDNRFLPPLLRSPTRTRVVVVVRVCYFP